MTSAARAIFAVLVAATFGAFFVAQRLKHAPTVLQDVRGRKVFSPNGDGRKDKLRVSFKVKNADVISVDVIDDDDEIVASLVEDRRVRAATPTTVQWNGREESGTRAPDGTYRMQVTLRNEGRTVTVRRRYILDTTPPEPEVTDVGPGTGDGPELLPNAGGVALIHTSPAGRRPQVVIFRTSGEEPEQVAELPLADRTARWDGKVDGRAAPPGTYLAVAQWRDRAGNVGSSVPLEDDKPELAYGQKLPGHGGITIRQLELQPPAVPVGAGNKITIGVDARGRRYQWSLRRLGATQPERSGSTTRTPFTVPAPRGDEGLFLFEAHVGRHVATAPVAVTNPGTNKVLVVLPFMTWQGRNPVDDDGDGAPNVLDRGQEARAVRVFAGGALPEGFREAEGPLLAYLSRNDRSFDITTDVALMVGRGPKLAGHRGVLLPGDVRWLPRDLQLKLRGFVRDGGTLMLTGTDSLRREVTFSPDGKLARPTPPAAANLFGTKLRKVVEEPTTVTNLDDKISLFSGDVYGGTGVFAGFAGYEPTAALGDDEELAADAVTGDGDVVLVAARYGKGLEIRTGLLDFATRLNADANTGQLALRAWTLLANG
ncbi:MAG: FlgD immunoglobulin-like domain containing protein [Solirubrobacteraceae bacterium]